MKKKKCIVCGTYFDQKYTTTQKVCSIDCAINDARNKSSRLIAKGREEKKKADRKDLIERKKKLKSRSDWLREAQTACNAYIRERDKGLPCISCGNTRDVKYCAGHYKTRGGYPELRFHPFNIHRQCDWNCNLNLSGNITNYRPTLIEKIGIKNVEWLEGEHQPQNWTIDDIIEIKQYYKEQLKILKNRGIE